MQHPGAGMSSVTQSQTDPHQLINARDDENNPWTLCSDQPSSRKITPRSYSLRILTAEAAKINNKNNKKKRNLMEDPVIPILFPPYSIFLTLSFKFTTPKT